MYICVTCNEVVGSERTARCPRGHSLVASIVGWTREETSLRAALEEFRVVCVFFVFAALAQYLWRSAPALEPLGFVILGGAAAAVFAAIRSWVWTRRGGAVARLAPLARGVAAGNAAGAAVCLLAGIRLGMLGDTPHAMDFIGVACGILILLIFLGLGRAFRPAFAARASLSRLRAGFRR